MFKFVQKLAILPIGRRVEDEYGLELLFRTVWADNADYMSIQYSGTGALKTDFTRTGKRTRVGLLKDGLNSMIRYFKNNFMDGFRQVREPLLLSFYFHDEIILQFYKCSIHKTTSLFYLSD